MTDRTIFITEFDLDRLRGFIKNARRSGAKIKSDLGALEKELDRAKVVLPREIPADVITMNSKIHFHDLESGEEFFYTLVFPSDADLAKKKISILAPIGTGLLGYCVGDVIEWKVPSGTRRFEILEVVYQPEAAGDFNL